MQTFTAFLTETTVNPNIVQYITLDMFKIKNPTPKDLDRRIALFVKKNNGTTNMFLGGAVLITVYQVRDAFYKDKAESTKQGMSRLLPGKEHFAIDNAIQEYGLDRALFTKYLHAIGVTI